MNENNTVDWQDEDSDFDFEKKSEQETSTEFATLLRQAAPEDKSVEFSTGDKVSGTINSIGEADILIDLGSKQVGILSKDELTDDDVLEIGATIEAIAIEVGDSEVVLSRQMKASLRSKEGLENAYQNKLLVKGRVIGKNKGGFDVMIGGTKAFCPVSQIDDKFIHDKSAFINQEFDFIVTQMKGRDVVVSRMAALKFLNRESRAAILNSLKDTPDKIFNATITQIREFGAFADMGGVEGLIHISELSHSRVAKPEEVVSLGDQVRVKVIKVQGEGDQAKVSISMKQASQDPWTTVDEHLTVGQCYNAKITRLADFGAFAQILEGVEGFIHISELSWVKRINHPKEILSVGDSVEARVINIDQSKRRIGLSLKSLDADPWLEAKAKIVEGTTIFAKVDSLKNFGALIELVPGVTGLLPVSTIKRAFGDSYRKQIQVGLEMEVLIKKRDDQEHKVLLALPNLEEDADDRTAFKEYMQQREQQVQQEAESKDRGSFGDLLAAKLKRN